MLIIIIIKEKQKEYYENKNEDNIFLLDNNNIENINLSNNNTLWIVDSGATKSIVNNINILSNIRKGFYKINLADNTKITTELIGDYIGYIYNMKIIFKDVIVCPSISYNVISVNDIINNDLNINFSKKELNNNILKLVNIVENNNENEINHIHSDLEKKIIHYRFGHPGSYKQKPLEKIIKPIKGIYSRTTEGYFIGMDKNNFGYKIIIKDGYVTVRKDAYFQEEDIINNNESLDNIPFWDDNEIENNNKEQNYDNNEDSNRNNLKFIDENINDVNNMEEFNNDTNSTGYDFSKKPIFNFKKLIFLQRI
ncbi:hypothetical protein U3516DRAFT_794275 [Neocallimastix sp. 'constans']